MQFDDLGKFKTKVDRTSLLVKTNKEPNCEPVLCLIDVANPPPGGNVPTLLASPYLKGFAQFTIRADSPRISYELPPTGFFIGDDGHVYRLTRTPGRNFKVGLNPDNTRLQDVLYPENNVGFTRAIGSFGYQLLVTNEYPSFSEAVGILRKLDVKSAVPISRTAYLLKNEFGIITLNYNSEMVCWFYHGDLKMVIDVPMSLLEKILGVSLEIAKKEVADV